MGALNLSNEYRREHYPKRKLRKSRREKGKSKLYSVRACRSSKRYRCLGIFVGFAAETTGWLVLVLRTSLFIFYLLARWVILSQRVPAELSDDKRGSAADLRDCLRVARSLPQKAGKARGTPPDGDKNEQRIT